MKWYGAALEPAELIVNCVNVTDPRAIINDPIILLL